MEEETKQLTKQQQDLVTENHKLIYFYAYRYNISIEECYDLLAIGLCKAALTYEENKGKFSTYAMICMRNELRQYWRDTYTLTKCIPQKLIYSLETPLNENFESNNWSIDKAIYGEYQIDISKAEVEEFIDSLKVRDRFILIKTLQGYTQASIAEELHISRSSISKILKRIGQKWSDKNYK